MNQRKKIIWSNRPNDNEFLMGGQDLRLYEYPRNEGIDTYGGEDDPNLKKEEPRLKAILMDHPYMKCFAWDAVNDIVALGYTTGKTVLTRTQLFDQMTGGPVTTANSATRSSIPNILMTASSSQNLTQPSVIASFLPKHSRACNAVSFCPVNTRLLLCGLDKVRSDFCLNVHDVEKALSTHSGTTPSAEMSTQNSFVLYGKSNSALGSSGESLDDMTTMAELSLEPITEKRNFLIPDTSPLVRVATQPTESQEQTPLYSLGLSESVNSADWVYASSCIVAGMGYRFIRVYDLRAGEGPTVNLASSISTRAVFNVVCDPFNINHFASFADDAILRLWDLRKSSEPVLSLPTEFRAGIQQVSWSTTHSGLLAASGKESDVIKVWHVVSGESETQDVLPCIWKYRQVKPSPNSPATSFTWIPSDKKASNRLQFVSLHGKDDKMEFITLHEHARMKWNPMNVLSFSQEKQINSKEIKGGIHGEFEENPIESVSKSQEISQTSSVPSVKDISIIMWERAKSGYSLESAHYLGDLCQREVALQNMWMYFVKSQVIKGSVPNQSTMKHILNASWFHGIASTVYEMKGFSVQASSIFGKRSNSGINMTFNSGTNLSNAETERRKILLKYQHKTRQDALEMCGWGVQYFDQDEGQVEAHVNRIEMKGEIEKAAYYALFLMGNPSKAIQILQNSKKQSLVLISAMLAGFVELQAVDSITSGASYWKSICQTLSLETTNAYLKAIFTFIAGEGDVAQVLSLTELPISSRIAIGLRYLDDEALHSYIEQLTQRAIEEGDIEGLLLTGLNPTAVHLFEKYVDRTGDVQTASIVLSIVVPRSFSDPRVDQWVESYRLLLDCWQLYPVRAKFDIFRRRYLGKQGTQAVPPQICIRCSFCSMTINRGFSAPKELSYAGAAANLMKPKMSSCPHCRKPLPRCAICLLQMGTPAEIVQFGVKKNPYPALFKSKSAFDLWFTWCQNCKHGGHARHMLEWFDKHDACPVSGCICHCEMTRK